MNNNTSFCNQKKQALHILKKGRKLYLKKKMKGLPFVNLSNLAYFPEQCKENPL